MAVDRYLQGELLFVTDPICSWCWATLPELEQLMQAFDQRLSFILKCAGLQVGSQKPLTELHTRQLVELWQQVAETTGQKFAFELPADTAFIYHSELACRALQIARMHLGEEPWALFHDMQEAFYVHCRNLGDPDVLYELVASTGVSEADFHHAMTDEMVVQLTRDEFDWCEALGSQALPSIWLDLGDGPKLVCGGYATADYLIPEIRARLTTH